MDPDNAIEDVNVRTIRLDHGKDVPRESISFPAFNYLDLVEQEWETSDLRSILLKPFLFVVYQEEQKKGRRVLVDARLWRMPAEDLEGEVRRVWTETVAAHHRRPRRRPAAGEPEPDLPRPAARARQQGHAADAEER